MKSLSKVSGWYGREESNDIEGRAGAGAGSQGSGKDNDRGSWTGVNPCFWNGIFIHSNYVLLCLLAADARELVDFWQSIVAYR